MAAFCTFREVLNVTKSHVTKSRFAQKIKPLMIPPCYLEVERVKPAGLTELRPHAVQACIQKSPAGMTEMLIKNLDTNDTLASLDEENT